jgi:Mrp family chromosome partitioning ATPase/capsular polysaccharide biosynthesis protein
MNERGSEPQAAEFGTQRHADVAPYATAGDYLRVLNRHKVLIAAITLAFVAAAFLYSATRTETYEATAQLSFQEVVVDLDLPGTGESVPSAPPGDQAATNANVIARPEVTREALRRLDVELSLDQLGASVSARVEPQTNLVIVEGRAADAGVAADVANAYARAAEAVVDREELGRIRDARRRAEREIGVLQAGDLASEPAAMRLVDLQQQLLRLETVEQVAEPAQIVRPAEIPDGPSSPKTKRDVALGGVLGLILGLVAAFGRAALDRRVHTAEQVHDALGAPVLAWVSDSALGGAGLAANGATPMAASDFEPFRVLRTNLAALPSGPPRSVLVTSACAEEGKSTVSMALASAAAIAGQRVLLVECDLHRPAFEHRLAIPGVPGLTDHLLDAVERDEILRTVELSYPTPVDGAPEATGQGSPGRLACVAAGTPVPNSAELLVGGRFRDFLANAIDDYDLVVVDSSPLLAVVDPLELVTKVDAALVCVRAERTTVDQVRAARAALANLPGRPLGAVLTGLRRGGPDSYDYHRGY